MSFLLPIVYLLLIVYANGSQMLFDEKYNPCQVNSGVFFYPHQSDIHKYYQCDESGNSYERSCSGNLVWDQSIMSCNWPSAVASPSPSIASTSTASPPIFITPAASSVQTTQWQSTTVDSSTFSLCKPINPCGEHGQCLELLRAIPHSSQKFACICSEDWFGVICDKHIDDLTTPSTLTFDQINKNVSEPNNTFSLPVMTDKDAKYIFYGLNGNGKTEAFNHLKKRSIYLIRKKKRQYRL